MCHPFFWDSEQSGYFLQDVSDWLVHDESNMNDVFNAMMDAAPKVLGGDWDVKMEALLLTYFTCQACFRYDNLLHLLLFIGNTLSPQQLLPKDIQVSILMSMFYVKQIFSITLVAEPVRFFMLIKHMKLYDCKI